MHPAVLDVVVQPGVSQRDTQGRPFTSYRLLSRFTDGAQHITHRRYSHFVLLHEQVHAACGLSRAFPPPSFASRFSSLFGSARYTMLQAYLHLLLPRGSSLPTLVTFVRAPPYAALGVAPMEAAAALPSATAAQALALLRGNQDRRQVLGPKGRMEGEVVGMQVPPSRAWEAYVHALTPLHPLRVCEQLILQAGMERVVSIARDHAKHKPLIDAGAVEWLCYVLREMAPGTTSFVGFSAVQSLGAPLVLMCSERTAMQAASKH